MYWTLIGLLLFLTMETTPPDRETSIEWTAVSKKRRVGASCEGAPSSKYGFRGRDPMLEVRCGARGLSYRAGNPGRAAPEVPLGEARQEERDEWQRSSHGQGREIPCAISGPSFPQWENMCFSSPGIGDQEDFHSDGGSQSASRKMLLLQDEQVLGAERMTRWDATAKVAVPHRHGESCPRREATPGKVHQGVWELQNAPIRQEPPAVLQLPEVWPHGQGHAGGTPRHVGTALEATLPASAKGQAGHPEVRQLWRGTRHHQPGVFQKANLGQQSQGSTEGRPTTGSNPPDKECLDQKVCTDNGRLSTNFNCRKGTSHTETYSGGCQATSSKTGPVATKTVVPDQRRQTSFVPRPVQRTVESQRCGVALKSPSPPQEEELEAIAIALNGATALLRRVSTGKRHLIPALQKMIEAALDALKTLSA